jgi:mono/diheme cytochrome c family protein
MVALTRVPEGDDEVRLKMSQLGFAGSTLVLLAHLGWAAPPPPAKRSAAPKVGIDEALEIPDAARDRRNPIVPSEDTLSAGRTLWRTHCETCHGPLGKGDGPNARLHEARKGYAPRNLTDPDVQDNLTDGEIFWRLSKGIVEGDNIIMPTYAKKVPSETDRWQLVLYVRHLGRAGRK